MAGKIIADTIEASSSQISLNVGNVTVLTASSSGLSSANLNFTGTGNRITGDMTTGTFANRVAFQTSTANSATSITAIPSGTGTQSSINLFDNSDPTNAGTLNLLSNATEKSVRAQISGTGTYLPLTFYTSGSERVRIDTSGNLLVGTTSNTRLARLRVNGDETAHFTGYGNGYGVGLFMTPNASATGGTANAISFQNVSNSTVGTISTTASATAYNTSSDYRLKEAIAPMTGALAKVALLKPCTYKWKTDGSDGQGFIAHELDEVVPGCVTGEKDAVDENGDIKPQGIDTSFLVATLTAAIQELKAIVDAQAVEIAALKAK